jgi:glycosyltransferase involved in cell wall biosynthesis
MNTPTLSVVVCTYRSYTHKCGVIEHTLLALDKQRDCHLIVVENSGDCSDREQFEAFISAHTFANSLSVIHADLPVGNARNLGARASTSDIIVFMDDDVILTTPNALELVKTHAQHNRHGYGALRPWTRPLAWFSEHRTVLLAGCEQGDFSLLLDNLVQPHSSQRSLPPGASAYLSRTYIGCFGYLTRALFEATGGFPDNFAQTVGGEDAACMMACYLNDGAPACLTDIQVAHLNHPLRYDNMTEEECGRYSKENEKMFAQLSLSLGIAGFNPTALLFPEQLPHPPVIVTVEEYLSKRAL